jgi:hypothetical protein
MALSIALVIAWFVLSISAMAVLLIRLSHLRKQLKLSAPEAWHALGEPASVGDLAPDPRWRRYLRERRYLSLEDRALANEIAGFVRLQRFVTATVLVTALIYLAARWIRLV